MRAQLFHLALPDEWESALGRGVYEISTRGATLAEVGFIHLAFAHQWPQVRQAFYADLDDLLLLSIDPGMLGDQVIVEVGNPATGEEFPHLYGPLPTSAVTGVRPLRLSPS